MASAKAPKRTLTYYSRLALWLSLLIIAAGLSAQSLQLNMLTQSNVDSSFTQAMAEQIERVFQLRIQDTKNLQKAASEHPYTLNALQEGDDAWLEELKRFLPGSQKVYVLDSDGASKVHESFGYTVQELVNRTLKGAEMRLEAVVAKGETKFYWATPIYTGRSIRGVLLVEYGDTWLKQLQQVVSPNLGQTILTQRFNAQGNGLELFKVGEAGNNPSLATTVAVNDIWFLTYTPNDKRPTLSLMPLTTPWVAVLVTTVLLMLLLMYLQRREIRQNQYKLITFVRTLTRQGDTELPKFSIRLFHDLAASIASQVRPAARKVQIDDARTEKPDLAIEPLRQKPYRVTPTRQPEDGMVVEEMNEDEASSYEPDRD